MIRHIVLFRRKRDVVKDVALEHSLNFEHQEALQTYLSHPAHQSLAAELKLYFEWAVADYTADSR